jgi:hypothetical protein
VVVDWMASSKQYLKFKNDIRRAGVRAVLSFQGLAEDRLLGSLI